MKKTTIKQEVQKAYAARAKAAVQNSQTTEGCCAKSSCCAPENENIMALDYTQLDGYVAEADLSLGCGIPTEIANISVGDTVVDLGSGAGNDVFVARQIVGKTGRVIGVDMTEEMIDLARKNTLKLGFQNVEFVLNDIEKMQDIPQNTADVVISNCVLNLVPNKPQVFKEIHRILKTNGHFSISDIVYEGSLPQEVLTAAELYVGCVAGASEKTTYLNHIQNAGFQNISIKRERRIELPDSLLQQYLSPETITQLKQSNTGIYSITVYADKLVE